MATEKITLPTEPALGSQLTANGDLFTRDKRTTGYSSLAVDGWRKADSTTAYTWAELFVYGGGELSTVEPSPVRAIVEAHISDPATVTKIVDALVASPHVDTEPKGKVKVGDTVTAEDYARDPSKYDHVKSLTDKDGDTVLRTKESGKVRFHISFHLPSDASGLDESPLKMWGPFTVKETD